jgi:putative hydrolase of the HAD superfamily
MLMVDSLKEIARNSESEITVIFDGDDTLWENHLFYDKAQALFQRRISQLGFDAKRAMSKRIEIDLTNMARMGFSRKRFPTSMVETYVFLCSEKGETPKEDVKREIFNIGNTAFLDPRKLYPEAKELLEELKCSGCKLVLLTSGDKKIQEEKVRDMHLNALFDTICIVGDKNVEVYRSVMRILSLDPKNTFMVGNSMRSDVLPALEAGLSVIHIPIETWAYEKAEGTIDSFKRKYHSAKNLLEVKPILEMCMNKEESTKAKLRA